METTKASAHRVCPQCGVVFRSGFSRCPNDGEGLSPMTRDLMVGKTLDRYEVEAFLGEGMTGRVYRARHVDLSRRYAIKVLYGDFSANPDMNARFLREAEAASRLDHPHLVHVFDARLAPGGPTFLVMDLVEGPTLSEWLQREGPWGEYETVELLRKLASGLAHAHAQGIIHRDIKPENVIFGPEPRLTDFGVAWVAPSPEAPQLTRAGEVLGTPGFIAPEVVMGHPATQRADLYALGMVGFQTLIGRHPYSGSEMEVMSKTLNKSVPALSEFGVEAPRLEPLLDRLVAADPQERPARAEELLSELDRLLFEEAPAPRQGVGFAVGMVAALVLVLGGGYALLGGGEAVSSAATDAQPEAAAAPDLEIPLPETSAEAKRPSPPPDQAAIEASSETPDPDGATAPTAPERAATPKPPRRRLQRRERPAAPAPRREAPAADEAPTADRPTAAEFRALYERVAGQLEALEGDDSAPLRERFMNISYTAALQDTASRRRAVRVLRALDAESRRR